MFGVFILGREKNNTLINRIKILLLAVLIESEGDALGGISPVSQLDDDRVILIGSRGFPVI